MLELDLRTIYVVGGLMTAVAAIAIGLQRTPPIGEARVAARFWGIGLAVVAAGFLLVAFRGLIPDVLSVVVGNAAIAGGYACYVGGVRAFRRHRPTFLPVPAAALLTATGMAYWWWVEPMATWRIVTLSGVAAVISGALLVVLEPWRTGPTIRSRRIATAVAGLFCLMLAYRAVSTALDQPVPALLSVEGYLALTVAASVLMNLCLAISFLLMLTERMSHDLGRAIERRDKLISILAHDLRTPFNTLLGGTEAMAHFAERGDVDRTLESARGVRAAAEQAYDLVDKLLFWVRHQLAGGAEVLVPVLDATAAAIAPLRAAYDRKGVSISGPRERPELFVLGDRGGLETAFRNICDNAMKFSPPGGSVRIEVARTAGEVSIAVIDRGVGMAPETRRRILDGKPPSSQSGTAGEPGTGIGLALCRDIVERVRGRLDIESEPGQGTIVRITLPLAG